MAIKNLSKSSEKPIDPFDKDRHGRLDRRSFLKGAPGLAVTGLTVGATFEMMRPNEGWAQARTEEHPASASLLHQLKTRFMFQISVDVATIRQGLGVAAAALKGGVNIVEMGTPLLKNEGVSNVVPAFRKQFPRAVLLADMKTMDGGASEARIVYSGGGNIFDLLALAGVDTVKAACGVRDEFRRKDSELARLVFTDIMVPHQGPAAHAAEVALRMIEAGVDGIGVHLQSDARHADPKLVESDYLGEMATAIFERVGKTAPVQVVGGLNIAQAKRLARRGLRAFVISGNLGQPDGNARYNLPPAEIEHLVAAFISEVSSV